MIEGLSERTFFRAVGILAVVFVALGLLASHLVGIPFGDVVVGWLIPFLIGLATHFSILAIRRLRFGRLPEDIDPLLPRWAPSALRWWMLVRLSVLAAFLALLIGTVIALIFGFAATPILQAALYLVLLDILAKLIVETALNIMLIGQTSR